MHAGHVFIGTGQGRDTGFLHRRIGGQEEVLHQGLHGAHEITGHDEIAQAPAGHGIGLGKTADDHGIVRVLQDGVLFRIPVGQAVIDLVGNDHGAQFGQGAHALRLQHDARGVAGGVDEHGPGARRDLFGHVFGTELEAFFLMGQRPDGHPARIAHEVGIAGIAGIGEDDFVARIEQGGEKDHHGRGRTGEDQHLVGMQADTIAPLVIGAQMFAQLHIAQGVGVVGLPFVQGLEGSLTDALGRIEIGFAQFQVDDGSTLPFELLGAFQHFHGQKRRDAAYSLGYHHISFVLPAVGQAGSAPCAADTRAAVAPQGRRRALSYVIRASYQEGRQKERGPSAYSVQRGSASG